MINKIESKDKMNYQEVIRFAEKVKNGEKTLNDLLNIYGNILISKDDILEIRKEAEKKGIPQAESKLVYSLLLLKLVKIDKQFWDILPKATENDKIRELCKSIERQNRKLNGSNCTYQEILERKLDSIDVNPVFDHIFSLRVRLLSSLTDDERNVLHSLKCWKNSKAS